MEKEYYTTKDVADLTGASRQIVRTYTDRYARYLSTEATPGPGQVRKFTPADVKLIAFVYDRTTNAGETHETVMESLARGDLERFEWQPERPQTAQDRRSVPEDATAALVPVERLQSAVALLQDAQRREQETKEENDALRDRIEQLQRELGHAQGELSAYKDLRPKRPKWLVWLLGE